MDILNFHPIRDLKRQYLLAEPFPEDLRGFVEKNVAHFVFLTEAEQTQLLDDARVFVSEKDWESGGNHELTDEMKITIAAQACLLLLGWDDARRTDLFPNVPTVIVYPTGYQTAREMRHGPIQVMEKSAVLGEAWSFDLPLILSWHSAQEGGLIPNDGHNVVLHEFAHKLDMLADGTADGVPRLNDGDAYEEWATVMSAEFAELVHDAETGQKSFLDTYGATNEAEFFAVATEAFFEKAPAMHEKHPALYAVLQNYYNQDTAARLATMQAESDNEDEEE